MKKKDELHGLTLFNTLENKGITTFKNRIGDSMVLVMMPTDFDEWEHVTVYYKKKVVAK